MYIVIVGGGKVGYYLTRSLVASGYEVAVVEKSAEKCDRIAEEIPGSVVVCGDGCEMATLEEVGLGRADLVIAVTGDDEDNLVVCQIAKRRFGVGRAIARINNPRNEAIFLRLGIDTTVSSTAIIEAQIEQRITTSSLVHLLSLHGMGIEIIELRLVADSPATGRRVQELGLPDDSLICMVIRNGKAEVPYGGTVLHAGDELVAVVSMQSEERLRKLLTG